MNQSQMGDRDTDLMLQKSNRPESTQPAKPSD
jgi:hypothetical protein